MSADQGSSWRDNTEDNEEISSGSLDTDSEDEYEDEMANMRWCDVCDSLTASWIYINHGEEGELLRANLKEAFGFEVRIILTFI